MNKILFYFTFILSFTFISCNDDKDDETKIDAFDYNILNEELDEQSIKIYDKDTALIFKDIRMSDHFISRTERYVHLDAGIDYKELAIFWNDPYLHDIVNGKDTFQLFGKYNNQNLKKGILIIKKMTHRNANSYTPPAKSDSISIEGVFNLQFERDNSLQMVKGIFYYEGKFDYQI